MLTAAVLPRVLAALCVASLPVGTRAEAEEREPSFTRGAIEREIAEARRRREELLEQILSLGSAGGLPRAGEAAQPLPPGPVDRHRAPRAPVLRKEPAEAFDQSLVRGPFPWSEKIPLLEWRLDADRDGRPEEVRYLDPDTRAVLRRHLDHNYDGRIDTWVSFQDGDLVERVLDSDYDGTPDLREHYRRGTMTRREADRDQDGVFDATRIYSGGWLREEQFDPDGDGRIDLVVVYDRGEVVERRQDVNGDGRIDVLSIYEGGKLVRREIRDPDLWPSDGPPGP